MTQLDLLSKILYLNPDAQLAIYDLDFKLAEESAVERCGFLIVWNVNNETACPSEEQLESVDQEVANQSYAQRLQNYEMERAKLNPNIKAAFLATKASNPDISFEEFFVLYNQEIE